MRRRRCNFRLSRLDGGFTLFEVVIAMAIIGIIAGSLAMSLHVAYGATREAEAAVQAPDTAAIALEFAAGDVENALAPGGILAGNFEGTQAQDDRGHEADDVIFYSTADGPQHIDGNGEVKKIELTVEKAQSSGEYVLVRRVTRNLLTVSQAAPDEEVLCRGVSSFTMQYFDGTNWHPIWDSTQEDNVLPAAVQMILVLDVPAGSGQRQSATIQYVRTAQLSCSMAPLDASVNTGGVP